MRACQLTTAVFGLVLSITFGTLEAIASTHAIALVPAYRSWALTAIIVTVVTTAALAILDRQRRILDRIERIESPGRESQARREFESMKRRMRTDGNNVTTLYPED